MESQINDDNEEILMGVVHKALEMLTGEENPTFALLLTSEAEDANHVKIITTIDKPDLHAVMLAVLKDELAERTGMSIEALRALRVAHQTKQ